LVAELQEAINRFVEDRDRNAGATLVAIFASAQ
jgi:hypothetical protein